MAGGADVTCVYPAPLAAGEAVSGCDHQVIGMTVAEVKAHTAWWLLVSSPRDQAGSQTRDTVTLPGQGSAVLPSSSACPRAGVLPAFPESGGDKLCTEC